MRSVTLLLPHLSRDTRASPSSQALRRILARATRHGTPAEHAEAMLCNLFDVHPDEDWPLAPLTLKADGGEPAQACWMRADPVHLRPAQDRLILHDVAHTLNAEQSRQLCEPLQTHFATLGMELVAPCAQRWYLRVPWQPALHTTPLASALEQSIDALLPRGEDALYWHGLINEAQMLLHQHPVNEAREAAGELPVNSLWCFGAGRMPQGLQGPFSAIWSEEPLARGLALACGRALHEWPADSDDWLLRSAAGDHLLVMSAAQIGDAAELDARWLAPLQAALRAGITTRALTRLCLLYWDDGMAQRFDLERGDLWKFWRRAAVQI